MTKIFYLAVITTIISSLHAADPEEFLEKQKMKYLSDVEKADKLVEDAKKQRDKIILKSTKDYIEDLEKVKTYWTKKGKLEKAMEFKKQIDELQKMVDAGEVKPPAPGEGVKQPENNLKNEPRAEFQSDRRKQEILVVKLGDRVFNDRDYIFLKELYPDYLIGKKYVQSSCTSGMSGVTCTRSGTVYAITPTDENDQSSRLKAMGFEFVERAGTNNILKRKVRRGDKISIPRWGFIIF